MKEYKIKNKDDFIKGWFIKKSICTDLIEYFEKKSNNHVRGRIGGGYKPTWKKSMDLYLSPNNPDLSPYLHALSDCMKEYRKIYPVLNDKVGKWNIVENINIQKYESQEGYPAWHCEREGAMQSNRMMVFMTYLNDVEEGGTTEWFYQKLKIKPKTGLTVIWPVDWMYTHRGNILEKGNKYIITGWWSYF